MSETELIVRTPRLDLVAATVAHLDAELQSHTALGQLLGASVPEDWPPGEYDRDAQEFFHAQLLSGRPSDVGWLTWYAITRNPNGQRKALVATAGFLGPPSNGAVEIGYSVVQAARGQGYAAEIVRALVAQAFKNRGVCEVVAHTSDENVASIRVLLGCGFSRVGRGPERGSVEYRTRRTPSA